MSSLYSSTNFFYHLRRSGEIVYNSSGVKGGFKLRLLSLVYIAVAILLVAFIGAVSVVGTEILDSFMPFYVSDIISSVFLTALAFAVALLLNLIACPYKIKVEEALCGSLLTTAPTRQCASSEIRFHRRKNCHLCLWRHTAAPRECFPRAGRTPSFPRSKS